MFRTYRSIKFLFTGPLILVFLFFVNLTTSPHEWWFQWAALGIGIAWVISLLRVLRLLIFLGGIAALAAYVRTRRWN